MKVCAKYNYLALLLLLNICQETYQLRVKVAELGLLAIALVEKVAARNIEIEENKSMSSLIWYLVIIPVISLI